MGYPARYPGTCPDCGTQRKVSGSYDAVFCPLCDEWQSPRCSECSLCVDRPARPSQATSLDLAPHERHADYNLDMEDEQEVLRRVVMPVLAGTLPDDAVRNVEIIREQGRRRDRHWPADLAIPEDYFCRITFSNGEQELIFLSPNGHVDPEALAERLADQLEDAWSESAMGWGQQIRAHYDVLPPRAKPAAE